MKVNFQSALAANEDRLEMHTDQKGSNVNNLFGVDVQYEVPRYQRRYVWGETNWSTLWEDIRFQLSLEFDAEERGHFTGNIVTRPLKGRQLDRFEIIDGQQRLATFQIILCVIRDLCQAQGESRRYRDLADDAARHIRNPDYVIEENTSAGLPDPMYKFIPTDYDKSAFQAIVKGTDSDTSTRVSDNKEQLSRSILGAYNYFKNKIRAYVGDDCDFGKIRGLLGSIKSDFVVVQITLDSSDQPEKIFESINATGRMLSEFDYLRNNFFLRAGQFGIDERENLYDTYWHFEDDSQYWDVDTLDSFFRAFLMAKWGLNCFSEKNTKPFELYQKYQQKLTAEQGIEYEFQQLRDYAKSYQEMNNPASRMGSRMLFYDDLQIRSLLPFVLHLKHEAQVSEEDLELVCDILESYLVRRMVCYGYGHSEEDKHAYSQIGKFFIGLVKGSKFDVKNLVRFLNGWQDNNRVSRGLRRTSNETFYGKLSSSNAAWSLLRYILYRIERDITERDNLGFRDFLDIPMRVMPELSRDDPEWRDRRDDWLSIGNLTFRAKNEMSLNEVDNLPFDQTKKILFEPPNIDFWGNREICEHETWDLEQIRARTQKIFERFNAIWLPAHEFQSLPPAHEFRSFNYSIKAWILASAQESQETVEVTATNGTTTCGTLITFNEQEICLCTEEGTVCLPRESVSEFTTSERLQGKVIRYKPNRKRPFGFIRDEEGNEIFFRQDPNINPSYLAPKEDDEVEFTLKDTTKYPTADAINITLVKE